MPTQSKFTKYFKLLGLPRTATESDIRDTYKKLARSYHPDKVSQEETAEANKYMAELNEARNILIKDCMPIRSALKRRHSSLEDTDDLQHSQPVPANFSKQEEPPSKRPRQTSDATEESIKSKFANTDDQIPAKQPFFGIDVQQIRIEFSEMTKLRLMEHCRQIGLGQSDLELRLKDSKADSIIFATSQKVRALLLENDCSPSDLDYHAEQLCQPSLTTKWAHNSKTACRTELTDTHSYDHIRVSKWTHWQLINELVKVLTRPTAIPAAKSTTAIQQNATHPTTELPLSPPAPLKLQLYHPQSHPELLQQNHNYTLPHPSKPLTTLRHEQSTITLSHATNLTLSSASHLLTLRNNSLEAALAHHTQLTATNSTNHLLYLQPDQQLIMRLSRETGLTAQSARLGLEALNYDYEAVRKRFDEEGGAKGIDPAFLVPDVKLIGWIDEEKEKDEELMEE